MSKGKILVVDDELEIVKSVAMRLEYAGYEVMIAMNGLQATGVAMKEKPDLIILDIGMPAGSGHEVVRCLRKSEKTQAIPVIYLTAKSSIKDYQHAIEVGVEKYITKPFQPDDLLSVVKEMMCKQKTDITNNKIRL